MKQQVRGEINLNPSADLKFMFNTASHSSTVHLSHYRSLLCLLLVMVVRLQAVNNPCTSSSSTRARGFHYYSVSQLLFHFKKRDTGQLETNIVHDDRRRSLNDVIIGFGLIPHRVNSSGCTPRKISRTKASMMGNQRYQQAMGVELCLSFFSLLLINGSSPRHLRPLLD